MKKFYLTVIIGFMLISNVEAKEIKGIIIRNQDTHHVTMIIPINLFSKEPNYLRLQYKIKYIDENGNKRDIDADRAEEIQFNFSGETIRMLARTYGHTYPSSSAPNIFLKLEIDGYLKLFKYYNDEHGASRTNPFIYDEYIFQKGNGELEVAYTFLGWRKKMASYFDDCPELSRKIREKTFNSQDIIEIVNYYNSECH